jgi:hypothetical protein
MMTSSALGHDVVADQLRGAARRDALARVNDRLKLRCRDAQRVRKMSMACGQFL